MLGAWKSQPSISEGPVCSFEGFQFGTRRAISAPEPEDPDREVVQPFGGIGGLHQTTLFPLVLFGGSTFPFQIDDQCLTARKPYESPS
jgi:hypothetical protein